MKILCISDTHGQHHSLDLSQYQSDILIHAGDFTARSIDQIPQVEDFLLWFDSLPFQHKILIAGNHDELFENEPTFVRYLLQQNPSITYLQDSSVTINGLKLYGSPWTPRFYDWAFMRQDMALTPIWNNIPNDTDILITHGPASYILDEVPRGNVGSDTLAERLETLPNLKAHIFGHIHESTGIQQLDKYIAVNASYIESELVQEITI